MKFADRSNFVAKPKHAFQLDDDRDFQRFHKAMEPVPRRVVEALQNEVVEKPAAYLSNPNLLLEEGGDGLVDSVLRQPDGTMVVACLTEMPGVTAEMWDWWFSWHSLASRRYRLWHPEDHIASSVAEDRRHVKSIRQRWVGNTSYVDELVGGDLSRLAISFIDASEAGLDAARVDELGVAICARISLRNARLRAGRLIHFVENTPSGARMHSRFHLGQGQSEIPLLGILVDLVTNLNAVRRHLLPDEQGLALLFHCSQEMNHLASILPALYSEFGHD